MIAPISTAIWQALAKPAAAVAGVFAIGLKWSQCFFMRKSQPWPRACSDNSTLTPCLRSGPSQAGPILCAARIGADCVRRFKFCFEIREIAVESRSITTNQRGSLPCVNLLSFSSSLSRRLPAACRTLHRAASPVLRQGPLWPMLSMKTSSRVPQSVALPGPQPAESSLVCRPATRATDPHLTLAARGRTKPTARTIRANRLGGPLHFACF